MQPVFPFGVGSAMPPPSFMPSNSGAVLNATNNPFNAGGNSNFGLPPSAPVFGTGGGQAGILSTVGGGGPSLFGQPPHPSAPGPAVLPFPPVAFSPPLGGRRGRTLPNHLAEAPPAEGDFEMQRSRRRTEECGGRGSGSGSPSGASSGGPFTAGAPPGGGILGSGGSPPRFPNDNSLSSGAAPPFSAGGVGGCGMQIAAPAGTSTGAGAWVGDGGANGLLGRGRGGKGRGRGGAAGAAFSSAAPPTGGVLQSTHGTGLGTVAGLGAGMSDGRKSVFFGGPQLQQQQQQVHPPPPPFGKKSLAAPQASEPKPQSGTPPFVFPSAPTNPFASVSSATGNPTAATAASSTGGVGNQRQQQQETQASSSSLPPPPFAVGTTGANLKPAAGSSSPSPFVSSAAPTASAFFVPSIGGKKEPQAVAADTAKAAPAPPHPFPFFPGTAGASSSSPTPPSGPPSGAVFGSAVPPFVFSTPSAAASGGVSGNPKSAFVAAAPTTTAASAAPAPFRSVFGTSSGSSAFTSPFFEPAGNSSTVASLPASRETIPQQGTERQAKDAEEPDNSADRHPSRSATDDEGDDDGEEVAGEEGSSVDGGEGDGFGSSVEEGDSQGEEEEGEEHEEELSAEDQNMDEDQLDEVSGAVGDKEDEDKEEAPTYPGRGEEKKRMAFSTAPPPPSWVAASGSSASLATTTTMSVFGSFSRPSAAPAPAPPPASSVWGSALRSTTNTTSSAGNAPNVFGRIEAERALSYTSTSSVPSTPPALPPPATAAPRGTAAGWEGPTLAGRSLAAEFFQNFLNQLGSQNMSERRSSSHTLEAAFFTAVGALSIRGDVRTFLEELSTVWDEAERNRKGNASPSLARKHKPQWVTAFFLGTWLNSMMTTLEDVLHGVAPSRSTIKKIDPQLRLLQDSWRQRPGRALRDACVFANQLYDIVLALYAAPEETSAADPMSGLPPARLLPVLLQRSRMVFEFHHRAAASEAGAEGYFDVCDVVSAAKTVTPKLFAVLMKRLESRRVVVQRRERSTADADGVGGGGADTVIFEIDPIVGTQENEAGPLVLAVAYLIADMLAADVPLNNKMDNFVESFHTLFPSARQERCYLCFQRADVLLKGSLTPLVLERVVQLLVTALALCGDGPEERQSRRLLKLKLLAAQLARGYVCTSEVPSDGQQERTTSEDELDWSPVELLDVIVAVKAASLPLLDVALRHNSVFYVQTGIYNPLQYLRLRIQLLMVVKFFMYAPREKPRQLKIADLVAFHHLPYSVVEAVSLWLLPLLEEMWLHGLVDMKEGYLLLDKKTPFKFYPDVKPWEREEGGPRWMLWLVFTCTVRGSRASVVYLLPVSLSLFPLNLFLNSFIIIIPTSSHVGAGCTVMESDVGQVYVTAGNPPAFGGRGAGGEGLSQAEAAADVRLLAHDFLTNFRIHNDFLYMRILQENLAAGSFFLEVEMAHLQQFSSLLGQAVQSSPVSTLPLLEQAVWEVATQHKLLPPASMAVLGGGATSNTIQVQIFWGIPATSLRHLAQAPVAKLVCVSGIVVKVSPSHHRCTRAAIQCTSCRSKTFISGRRSLVLPQHCLENNGTAGAGGLGGGVAPGGGGGSKRCRPNPYVVLPMECQYEDQQVLKLQELPEEVPTGELPRHVTVVLDRYLVDRVCPGSRVQIAGIVSVQEHRGGGDGGMMSKGSKRGGGRGAAGLRAQYLRSAGLMYLSAKDSAASVVSVNHTFSSRVHSRSVLSWQPEEEASFKAFAKSGEVYQRLTNSIDPAIFGLQDQKRAIVCLLFGGTRKRQGSNYLRGDMNVLLVGDPSTAKSQLLKFTEKVAPIGIYTSGKGSSAAGLTASVVSNGNGEFALEAGSMVLADGGVVCIDEFDKMRDQDQVAIHEAMEQQTISIAKANLTTMLNSRTSVLAAANPTLGSYDPLRSNEDQMDFQSSILSRFDLIFKVIDPRNPETDNRLAHHVVGLHKGASSAATRSGRHLGQQTTAVATAENAEGEANTLDRGFMTKYISFARATCFPTISEEAMAVLLDFYVQVRRDAHKQTLDSLKGSAAAPSFGGHRSKGGGGGGGNATPIIQITARQLESLVRITESQAKMRLDVMASRADAEEAIRLFKVATVDAINSGVVDQSLTEVQNDFILRIEEALRRRVALGATVEHNRLLSEMSRMGFDTKLVDRALFAMVRREELAWRKQRTLLHRMR
eukprot:gene7438-5237_t